MEITILQNGNEIPLRPGMSATLEFLLPTNTPLLPGEIIPLWYFDEVLGLWVEEGSGLVGVSSFDPGRLSVVGTVNHFTWWNCDQPITTKTCLTGTVRDADGNPVGGAQVMSFLCLAVEAGLVPIPRRSRACRAERTWGWAESNSWFTRHPPFSLAAHQEPPG